MASCSGNKADGGRCNGQAIAGSRWCFSHHPDYEERRRRRASKGGKRGGRGRPQAELADVKRRLSDLAEDVLAGKANRSAAAVAGQLLNTYIRAVGVELRVREQQDLLERLEALEAILEQRNGGGKGGKTWRRA